MKAIERAEGFVSRADHALLDPANAAERWGETIRSKTDERLVHSFPTSIDRAVRRVDGRFAQWAAFEPEGVADLVAAEAFQVLSVLSAHPSGWVREEVVMEMAKLKFDRVAPHLANRTLDFVPKIREAAQPVLWSALTELQDERTASGSSEQLPSAANIAIARLMRPRAATLCPELVQLCIALGRTSPGDRPGRLRDRDDPMLALAPFRKALQADLGASTKEALGSMIDYLTPSRLGA